MWIFQMNLRSLVLVSTLSGLGLVLGGLESSVNRGAVGQESEILRV